MYNYFQIANSPGVLGTGCLVGATHILKGLFVIDSQIKKLGNNLYELNSEAKNRLESALNIINTQKLFITN